MSFTAPWHCCTQALACLFFYQCLITLLFLELRGQSPS